MSNTLYQYSTFIAVQNGLYDGDLSLPNLQQRGDFGLGSFNALEGELIALHGKFFHCTNGKAQLASASSRLCWAAVCKFNNDLNINITTNTRLENLKASIEKQIGSKNFLLAIHISGKFSKLKIASVPKQTKPYKTIKEIIDESREFDLHNIQGDAIGFFAPDYMEHIKMPGYHFHFIDNTQTIGGHVLDFELAEGLISLQKLSHFTFELPNSNEFSRLEMPTPQQDEHVPVLADILFPPLKKGG